MAIDYGTRRSLRSKKRSPHQFLVITVVFLLGYFAASVFDVESVTHWLNTQVLAHHAIKKEVAKSEAQHTELPPKPKFEFYTLLANEKVSGSQSNTNTTVNQPNAANTSVLAASQAVPANTSSAAFATSDTRLNTAKEKQHVIAKVAKASPSAAASQGRGNYLVQVASFKARQDAEHMKGSLILKGFDVYVVPVTTAARGNWFRVVVGPYSNRIMAQKAQETLARNEHLHGMITGVNG